MKKTALALFITASLLMGNTAFASTSTAELMISLQAQIAALTAKLTALKQAQSDVVSAKQSINDTLGLIGDVSEGMTGEQVLLLQATLANDPDVYSGNITGYYGKLTREAIKKFQKKNGLHSNGKIDRATLAKLNRLLNDSSFGQEDDGHGKKRFCDRGTRIVWEKKNNGKHRGWERVVLPRCKHIPGNPGNVTTTPPVSTTTPDTTAPIVSAISVGSIGATSVITTWSTNEVASSKVYLSTSSPTGTVNASWTDATMSSTHTATLTGLHANTTYYFVIEAKDAAGNKTLTAQGSFTTLVAPDVTPPILSAFSVAPTSSTTGTVVWATNESASGKVYYSSSTPVHTGSALFFSDTTLVTAHSMSLTGLTGSTTYYVIVESRDAAGNAGLSTESTFTTLP